MKNNSFIKNFLYNISYQLLLILTPFITTPYISRVLEADGIGTNSYTLAVAQLFCIMGMMGISNYGNRMIAYVRDNKKELTEVFWGIWSVQLICGVLSTIIYLILFVWLNILGYRKIFLIQTPIVLGAILDISWLYMGVEDFKKTVTRNIIVKLSGIICIFIFVRNEGDLAKYVIINSFSTFLGMATLWIFTKEYVTKFNIMYFKFKNHIKDAFIMLVPLLSIQIYTGLDRTIIGGLSTITEVGYYDQSQKLSRIALAIVTSLSTVLMPRIANMYANNNTKQIEYYLKKSLHFTVATSCLISAGMISISFNFVPIFFGQDFKIIIPHTIITSIIVILIPLGGVFANQYALPTGKNKEYVIPLITAAIINIISNVILVPRLGAMGGVLSIVFTEFITMILRIVLVKKYLNSKILFYGVHKYFIITIISVIITMFLGKFLRTSVTVIFVQGLVCTIIFLSQIILLNNPIQEDVKNGMRQIYNKLLNNVG